ncbi:MAG TPA: DUF975 family protein [Bacilli bacterium]|nr:DUF975 family protein [Bacilli bacterium]
MDRKKIKLEAKSIIHGNVGILFLCALLVSVMAGVASSIPLASFIVVPCFSLSTAIIYLNLFKKREPEIENIFWGFKDFERAVIAGLLMYLYTFLWTLLFIIPGIIKSYAYSLTQFILAEDPKISSQDAIKKSEEMMMGHKWEMFVLDLSFIGWHLLGCITFGLIYIYAGPYMNAAKTNFYLNLKKIEK